MRILQSTSVSKSYVGLPSKASVSSGTEDLGPEIDMASLPEFNSGQFSLDIGAATGTPTSFSAVFRLLQADASGGSYVEVAGTSVTRTATGVFQMAFRPGSLKRFVRLGRTVTISGGTSPTLPNSAQIQLFDPKYGPANA